MNDNLKVLFSIQEYFKTFYPKVYGTEISESSFMEDFSLFKKFEKEWRKKKPNIKLMTNYIIILHNVFPIKEIIKAIPHIYKEHFFPIINTFLLYLNYLTEKEREQLTINKELLLRLREENEIKRYGFKKGSN